MFEFDEYSCSEPFNENYMNALTPPTPTQTASTITNTRKKGCSKSKNKNKRRFSDDQVKSLETMFESETRLEPRKKLQLAKDLGLQPRQVAIWFQNKRARWKSKQLEQEFSVLRANYNNLASKFDSLKKEKQALILQLQKLNDVVKEPRENGKWHGVDNTTNNNNNTNTNTNTNSNGIKGELHVNIENGGKIESEVNPSLSIETSDHVRGGGVLSDGDSGIKAEYFEGLEEGPQLMTVVERADGSLTSQEDWGSLDSDSLFDQSSNECQWWDFWA